MAIAAESRRSMRLKADLMLVLRDNNMGASDNEKRELYGARGQGGSQTLAPLPV